MSTLVLVDGPNLYNDIERWFASNGMDETLRPAYYRNWFDIDRVVEATIDSRSVGEYGTHGLGIVIFHSDRGLGRGPARLTGADVDQFWGRQATADGCSTALVTVPGHQPEKTVKCQSCQKDVAVETRSEKGVDTSMVTYLYEAAEQWDRAVLFTNDADFVPPILALRRRGKRVFVAAVDTAATGALKRASQTFFPVKAEFLALDFKLFQFLQPGGAFDQAIRQVRSTYSTVPIWTASDGRACPMILLNDENGNIENTFRDAIGGTDAITWFTSNKGREGRIFYKSGFSLGDPVQRHRHVFTDALWVEHWRD